MYSQNRLNINRIPYYILRSAYSTCRVPAAEWATEKEVHVSYATGYVRSAGAPLEVRIDLAIAG